MARRTVTSVFLLLVFFGLARATDVVAQTVRTGSINGTVKDESNLALPGVAITVTGPALQVPQLVQVAGSSGEYQITDLPPGTYQVTFELTGFAKTIREGVIITSGFVARVDASLKVASIEEAVTVSAQSPVIDVQNTRGGASVSEAVLNAIPNNRNYQDIMNLTPGMVTTTPPQGGVIGMKGEANGFKNYGATLSGQERVSIEGVDMQSNENPDFSTVEEVDAKTFGNTAEISTPGASLQLIVKSGGNAFHGRYQGQYMTDKLQANNVDAALLSQGIAAGDTAVYYTDLSGDLGGRLVKDKLWFYGALRAKSSERTLPGYSSAPGRDGLYGTSDDVTGHPVVLEKDQLIKTSWQPTPNNKVIGFYSRNKWDEKQYLAQAVATARFIPEEATPYLRYYNYQSKGEWQGTLSNRLFASVMVGDGWYVADYTNDCNVPDRPTCRTPPPPASIDLATQIQTGTPFVNGLFHRPRDRYQLNGTLSYSAHSHLIRMGYMTWWQRLELQIPDRGAAGNYQLVFDNGVPNEFVTTNFPVDGKTALNTYAGFVQDTWTVSRRLTANLGFRLERSHARVPPQTKVQGIYGTSGSFAEIDGGTWTVPAPRTGLAFDVSGDGKTVIKGTFGRYNHDMGDGFANAYNPNTQTNTTYRWHDLNGDKLYDAGEVNLDTNGLDFVSISGGSTTVPNLALKDPHTNEATGSIEREFAGALSLRGLWVFKQIVNDYAVVNIAIPFSAWSIPVVRQDPGSDGVYGTLDDGGNVTLYDFTSNYKGSKFVVNEYQNRPNNQDDHFNSFEVTLNKRARAATWFGSTSFLATKNHRFINGIPTNPNQELFNLDSTWDWTYRLSGSYSARYGVNLSALYTLMRGLPGQRTYIFRAADPSPNKGLALSQVGNLTVPLDLFGAQRGPVRPNLNLRASKSLTFHNRKISLDFDILNVMNSNPSWATTYASGPTYGYITSIQPPRIARIGAAFEF